MALSELSASTQNYLKAILSLQEWSTAPVTPTLVAERTGMKLSTVSDAMRRLADRGLVEHAPYGAITLTSEGQSLALGMMRRHRLIETFLVDMLGYSWDLVHDEAESLEHAVSDTLIDRLDVLLGKPVRDPHGDPIPGPDGTITYPAAQPLSDLPPGAALRVERISDADPALLQYFSEHGIGVGAAIHTREGAPYSGAIEVQVGDATASITLGRPATEAVWVSVLEAETPARDGGAA